jgi:hypothetical protein
MRVRPHRVQQATGCPGTADVTVTMVVTWLMVVTAGMIVTAVLAVIVVRAARAVHIIQHARETALPHINTYQGRALAN